MVGIDSLTVSDITRLVEALIIRYKGIRKGKKNWEGLSGSLDEASNEDNDVWMG